MSRELRLVQEAHRRAREAEAEVARLTPLLGYGAREREQAVREATLAAAATVARLERRLAAERHQAARDLAVHDRDRRIAQRQLRVAEGALHAAVRHGWLGAEEAQAALEEIAAIAAQERDLARLG